MMYLRYTVYAFVALVAFVFTYVTCPLWAFVAALFKLESLPWVTTTDDNVYGANFRSEAHDYVRVPQTIFKRWTTACWWIWRNPNYKFNTRVLGLTAEGTTTLVHTKVGEEPNSVEYALYERDGKRYFGYFKTKTYGKKYFKLWFGWQFHLQGNETKYMLKFAINPIRSVK